MQNRIFENTYRILREIGKGGMSTVYLAEHLRLGTQWAVKQVRKDQIRRFDVTVEANILKRLSHPMLPRIIDVFEDAENVYIVEDYIPGVSMEQHLLNVGKVGEAQAVVWFIAICQALIYLHSQPNPIIYRDMKPSNIIVQTDGTLKLIDFGIAREYKSDSTSDTAYIGTRGYAAPEQFGKSQTDVRTDIYSLGVTMYRIVTGKSPYEPPYSFVPVRTLDKKLSAGIEYILEKCTRQEPEDRYQSVKKLYEDLVNIHKFDSAFRRRRAADGLAAAAVFIMLIASAALVYTGIQQIAHEKNDYYSSLLMQADNIAAKDYEGAITLIEDAQGLYPDEPQAYIQKAYTMYQTGYNEDCIGYITDVLFPGLDGAEENGDLNAILAAAYFNEEDYINAAFYFSRSAGFSELNVDQLRDYAVSVGRAGSIEKAKKILSEIFERGASSVTTDFVGGEIEYALGNYTDAEQLFMSALSQSGDRALRQRIYLSLAELYRDASAFDKNGSSGIDDPDTKEIRLIEQAIDELSLQSDAGLYELLGAAYFLRGMADGCHEDLMAAAESFEQVLRLGAVKDYIYTNIFTAYQYAGEYELAKEILGRMKKAYPDNYLPYVCTAMILITEENLKPEEQRDYSLCYQEYLLAKETAAPNDDTTRLQQLESLIEQLREGGWLEGV